MGTIIPRKRKDGSIGYTAQIRIQAGGKLVFSQSQTFEKKTVATKWLQKREAELAEPGAFDKPHDPPLSEVIDQYNSDKLRAHGKTKTQVLRSIQAAEIGGMKCSEITSQTLVKFAQSLDTEPSTRLNYISHLASIFAVARPAWGYPLDKQAIEDAKVVLNKMGVTGKSKERSRRPTLEELDRLMRYYTTAERKHRNAIPMTKIIMFAIFSTRRQEEITRMVREDLLKANLEIIVRDMKNPGEKIGNDVTTTLTPEALQLIHLQPVTEGRIWPFNADSISTSFTRACKFLGIGNLHFHDLRHDGISRLFELGWSIPRVSTVSGHRSWSSLKRYTHIRQTGDKYKDWPWLQQLTSSAFSKAK